MSDSRRCTLNLDKLDEFARGDEARTIQMAKAVRGLDGVADVVRNAHALLQVEQSAVAQAKLLFHQDSYGVSAAEFRRHEELQRLIDPYCDIQKTLGQSSANEAALEAFKRQESLATRATAFGHEVQATATFAREMDRYRDVARQYAEMFRLPRAVEAAQLIAASRIGAVAELVRGVNEAVIQRAALEMKQPWVRHLEEARSASALLELQGLGLALRSIQGFDDRLTMALRTDLGDWRDRITFPDAVFEDAVARTGFYVRRGFNTALTDFTDEAFQEGIERAGFKDDLESVDEWPDTAEEHDPIEEAAFRRTNKCHDRLQRLERGLREFIDDVMTAQYGSDWPMKRLPPKMFEEWQVKRSKVEAEGLTLATLIEVADFTDYEVIICRKDHWREIFQVRFRRKESVRESFQRLRPIRLATMHARFVTKEDELYALAETLRLLRALR